METELLLNILISETSDIHTSKQVDSIARKFFSELPDTPKKKLILFEHLAKIGTPSLFTLMTIWIKRLKFYEMDYFKHYENWLFNYTDTWNKCDVFCYRVLNPMIEKYPSLLKKSKVWVSSKKIYVKRASTVCMIHSSTDFSVNVAFRDVEEVCNSLIKEKHIHIQKGVGWLLKYTYVTYPEETINYLKDNVDVMSRTTFRYALEKMPIFLKQEMMKVS